MLRSQTSARQALLDLAVALDLAGLHRSAAHALRLAGRMGSN